MASLKDIKLKILSYKKTGTVTRAMEAVSAVKMRKSQERAIAGRAYAAAALSVLERLASAAEVARHPLMQERGGKTCIVIITSDKGLAGALNSGVIRRVEHLLTEKKLGKENVIFAAIGRRGADYFASRGYEVRIRKENIGDEVPEEAMHSVIREVLAWHETGEIGTCTVAYQNFISTFEQHASVRQIIPIKPEAIREIVANIRPVRGKYAPSPRDEKIAAPAVYTIEPDPDTVFASLLPRLLSIALFHTLLEGKASEHSARMIAMKSATDKANEMAHGLTRTFNKVRQAAITREVSEITSGIEAMK